MARGQGFVTKCVAGRAWPEPKSVGILGGNWRRRSPFIPGPQRPLEQERNFFFFRGLAPGYLLFSADSVSDCRRRTPSRGGARWGPGPAPSSGSSSRPGTRRRPRPTRRAPVRPAPPRPPRPAPPRPPPCAWGGTWFHAAWWDGARRGAGPGGTAPGRRWPGPVRHARTAPPARPAAGLPTAARGWKAGRTRTHPRGRRWKGTTRGFLLFPLLAAWTAGGVPANHQGFLLFPLLLLGLLLGAFLPRRERDRGAPSSAFSPAAGG